MPITKTQAAGSVMPTLLEKRIKRVDYLSKMGKICGVTFVVSISTQITLYLCTALGFLDASNWLVMTARILVGFVNCITLLGFWGFYIKWSDELIITIQDLHHNKEIPGISLAFVVDIFQHRRNYAPKVLTNAEAALLMLLTQSQADQFAAVKPQYLPCLYACLKQSNDELISIVLKVIEHKGTNAAVPYLKELIDKQASTLHDNSIYVSARQTLTALETRLQQEKVPQTLLRAGSEPVDILLRPIQEIPQKTAEADNHLPRSSQSDATPE